MVQLTLSQQRLMAKDSQDQQPNPQSPPEPSQEELLKEALQRSQAELENFRKRVERDRRQVKEQANRDLIVELLPVIDVFEMALGTITEHNDTTKGFEMVLHQLKDLLKRFGVTIIEQVNVPLDPAMHEKVGEVNKEGNPTKVAEIVTKGYKLGDYVIRAARVKTYEFRGCGSGRVMAEEMRKHAEEMMKKNKENKSHSSSTNH